MVYIWKVFIMNEKGFSEELNKRFNDLATLFYQLNQCSEESKIELHSNILIKLSCFSHFLIEHSSYIKELSKEYLSMIYTLLSLAKAESLSSAFELEGILESQGISR